MRRYVAGAEVNALVDGHCHQVLAGDLDRRTFAVACTGRHLPRPADVSAVDTPLGLAIRRWCPPAVGLPPHAGIDDYLARRAEVGWRAATSALLRRAGLAALVVDTGLGSSAVVELGLLSTLAGAPVLEVVRLESVAEQLAGRVEAARFADEFAQALAHRVRDAVAVKSIIGYRSGLGIPPARPAPGEVRRAAGQWLRTGGKLVDPVLLTHVLWAGVDTGLPLQLHTGHGDSDLNLRRADPALAQPFLAAVEAAGVPVILLHGYPYHRNAGWLAQVYPHVYLDIGLTITQLGIRSSTVLAEYFELAPFHKLLFSTDAYLLPELYLVGAAQFRQGLHSLLAAWLTEDAIAAADAERIADQVCAGNARQIYRHLGP